MERNQYAGVAAYLNDLSAYVHDAGILLVIANSMLEKRKAELPISWWKNENIREPNEQSGTSKSSAQEDATPPSRDQNQQANHNTTTTRAGPSSDDKQSNRKQSLKHSVIDISSAESQHVVVQEDDAKAYSESS